MKRSYYSDSIGNFLKDDTNTILGHLSRNHTHVLEDLQKNAWIKQIEILKRILSNEHTGKIYFEFSIPRMGKRVDNIIIINDIIFVLEFKVGARTYEKHSILQAVDYCLDLQNFHEGSHFEKLVPILVATKALATENTFVSNKNLFEPIKANELNLGELISQLLTKSSQKKIDTVKWEESIYKPTPTIIEAAQALYKGHNVKDISRNDAGAINLTKTTDCLNEIIEEAKGKKKKIICFLTGVPGAGKTLAGLNIANERIKSHEEEHAVFLSGNGPLVDVLREALTRDEVLNTKEKGGDITKKRAEVKAKAFIQNIHHFRDDNLITDKPPIERVVVFDEAQRAWNKEKASSFMKKKKGIDDFAMSEPEFLIKTMDKHTEWAVVICLIGGGQEINTGEAGVSEWIEALKNKYYSWQVYYSNLICHDDSYISNTDLIEWVKNNGISKEELHLTVSVRSFRSEKVSELAHAIIKADNETAELLISEVKSNFPIYITRDLIKAKKWLKAKAKGTERIGIIASSGARRLRPLGIDVKNKISAPYWFLNDSWDIRSSNHLEEIATEFDIQGLEIDYSCLSWDINFYFENNKWNYQRFEGTAWRPINVETEKSYMLNTYRVLLTRARQGMIIYVPNGDDSDHTRPIKLYDKTFNLLVSCGITEL